MHITRSIDCQCNYIDSIMYKAWLWGWYARYNTWCLWEYDPRLIGQSLDQNNFTGKCFFLKINLYDYTLPHCHGSILHLCVEMYIYLLHKWAWLN